MDLRYGGKRLKLVGNKTSAIEARRFFLLEDRAMPRNIFGKSDYQRWENEQNLSAAWDSRTKQIADLVEPGKSIIEFGAGRLVLKEFIPGNCSYTPSDLVDRGYGTIVCDLNSTTLPDLQKFDIAVFSGVLEYIYDVPRLILYLSSYVDVIIASYAVTDTNESDRHMLGWVNDYSSATFAKLFANAGFQWEREQTKKWEQQLIYKFTNTKCR